MEEREYLTLFLDYDKAMKVRDTATARQINQRIYEEEFKRYLELIGWKKYYLKNYLNDPLIKEFEDGIKITMGRLDMLMKHAVSFVYAQQNDQEDK